MSRDEQIIAYLDGELDASARARFEAEMAADPALAAQVERHRRLGERVAGAWASVLEEPVPEALRAAANRPASVEAKVFQLPLRPRLPSLPEWAAMAACLAVGLFVGQGLAQRGPLSGGADGRLTARGALAEALTEQTAAEVGGGPIKVGLSFRTPERLYCRTFESGRDRLAGVACREDGRWAVRMATAYQPPAASPDYRMAASGAPPAVLAAVDAMIAGEPLDAAGEAAARARGWTD